MKSVVFALLFVFSAGMLCSAQGGRVVPPGTRHAQELEAQNEKDFPPAGARRPLVSAATLQHEADQLAELAATVGPKVQNLNRGLLEKDLVQKLKEIEGFRNACARK